MFPGGLQIIARGVEPQDPKIEKQDGIAAKEQKNKNRR